MQSIDPEIYYVVVAPNAGTRTTLVAGFSLELCHSAFLFKRISRLPTDVFELAVDPTQISTAARRANGLAHLSVNVRSPLAAMAWELSWSRPFTMLLLGPGQDVTPFRDWASKADGLVTIVSETSGDMAYSDLTRQGLRSRFLALCDQLETKRDAASVAVIRTAIQNWKSSPERSLPYEIRGHGSVNPNLRALGALGFADPTVGAFEAIGPEMGPYVDQILLTSRSVLDERAAIPPTIGDAHCAPTPAINLFAPAMYSGSPDRVMEHASIERRRDYQLVKGQMERQKGYSLTFGTPAQIKAACGVDPFEARTALSPTPHPLIVIRGLEASLANEAVGLMAASELGAVIRLPNGVNLSAGAVRQFAIHHRENARKPLKAAEAFERVQKKLAEAVPASLWELVRTTPGDIRIMADAHLEWLDMDGIPLGLRRNVSRIPVTPGNLFIEQVLPVQTIELSITDFAEVLIISALRKEDPIRPMMEIAAREVGPNLKGKMRLRFAEVANADDLVSAMNAFEGAMMIFDGHNTHKSGSAASLLLKGTPIDIWSLRDRAVRVPPIVVLSACETHALTETMPPPRMASSRWAQGPYWHRSSPWKQRRRQSSWHAF